MTVSEVLKTWYFLSSAFLTAGQWRGLMHRQTYLQFLAVALNPEVESRTQSLRPRPRTQKNPRTRTALPRTDPLEAKDRNARGQGPRTQAQMLTKKEKRLQNFFSGISKKRASKIFFQAFSNKKRLPKLFFRRSTKFQQFKKKCSSRVEDRAIFEDLRS